jgi:hypothetical protein
MTPNLPNRARILDATFDYKPSFNTDIRKTFERARAQQAQDKADSHSRRNVLQLDGLRKLSAA